MSQKEEENPVEEIGKEKRDTQEKEGILPERAEEAKLKAKYLSLGQKPGGGYNMAKAEMKNKQLPRTGPDKNLVTGDHIPTPQDLPQRKSSLVTSKLAGGQVERCCLGLREILRRCPPPPCPTPRSCAGSCPFLLLQPGVRRWLGCGLER
uniref:Uncharacterized protein n=1 Tax=Mandrillus leucophaeus TaxID=9568 RepID=A0A2K5Y417_MANLE